MGSSLKVLDCTLRDGGQGLEDFAKNGIKTEFFTEEERNKIASCVRDSGIDIVELGSMAESVENKEKFAIYRNVEELSRHIPKRINTNQMYVGLYIGPDTPLNEIPSWNPELVDGIRVILRYSELEKSINYCAALAKKGFKVFMQPMLTMRYTDEDLDKVIYAANEMGAFAVYFVDSFGYMNEQDVERLFHYYVEKLDPKIHIGFHAHNNMERAFGNVRYFIEHFKGRDRIVDSCVTGMGQGAGNLQTEVLVDYLNKNYGTDYDFNEILSVCEMLNKFRMHDLETWGYTPLRLIPAIHNAAYKYAVAMRIQYDMSLIEINNVLSRAPDELKHRYTPENLKKLLAK